MIILQDALTLQRLVLEKKVELVDDWSNEVPDIKGALQEMMTSLFISTYNHQVCDNFHFNDICFIIALSLAIKPFESFLT